VPLPPDIVAGLARRLADHAGLELPPWVIESRAQARMAVLGVEPARYLELVRAGHGASELIELIEAVRVGETRLFRHRSQVTALGEIVVPALRARGRRTVKVWSVGCAAGEEAYTLAIVLSGHLPGASLSVLATDVSADALETARAARYPAAALDDVPAQWRDGFDVEDGVAQVRPEIAQLVRFEQRNLADAEQPRGFDLVWCRNVLIYFTPPARRRAVEKLVASLEPGGFLFVGYSETLRDVPELEAIRTGSAVCYQRRTTPRVERTPPAQRVDDGRKTPPPLRPTPPPQLAPPEEAVIAIRGAADIARITQEIMDALRGHRVRRVVVDLDQATMIPDDVAAVIKRARAASAAEGVELVVRATKPGASRWLRRHGLDEPSP
jgi:chemotaxis protein methyltransferase CheR